ncbi:hypothetical protein BaRGS_00006138 [Batillaria attramentaria]|uniref:Uncharacterized protein n=1 Tax=Batillaria attramentaria TaxID=370345 RepID=A0ABD0LTW2_9CAEN
MPSLLNIQPITTCQEYRSPKLLTDSLNDWLGFLYLGTHSYSCRTVFWQPCYGIGWDPSTMGCTTIPTELSSFVRSKAISSCVIVAVWCIDEVAKDLIWIRIKQRQPSTAAANTVL